MKVVFSRKGFDTTYGGTPSPILPDGTMISVPIPADKNYGPPYSDLQYFDSRTKRQNSFLQLMKSLGKNQYKYQKRKYTFSKSRAHLDPDLRQESLGLRTRQSQDWRGTIGINGDFAEGFRHEGIGKNDLFLFFGWFQRTKLDGKAGIRWDCEDEAGQKKHVLFGYLQIDRKLDVDKTDSDQIPPWLNNHPHIRAKGDPDYSPNVMYIARKELKLDRRMDRKIPGWGTFRYDQKAEETEKVRLTLTKPGYSMSRWDLPFPKTVHPRRLSKISHIPKWRAGYFKSPCIGQEFSFDENNSVRKWAEDLICKYAHL